MLTRPHGFRWLTGETERDVRATARGALTHSCHARMRHTGGSWKLEGRAERVASFNIKIYNAPRERACVSAERFFGSLSLPAFVVLPAEDSITAFARELRAAVLSFAPLHVDASRVAFAFSGFHARSTFGLLSISST